ncbi:MAG: penicillin-binding protein activator [candidate division KSB1 bacterium]|nr:penicillin-binding protein activator [candidate division KSB1 bacterium]
MKRAARLGFLPWLFVGLVGVPLWATAGTQEKEGEAGQFHKAVELFRQGEYPEAESLLEGLVERPGSPLASAAQVMLARSLYRQGRVEEAGAALEEFSRRYPRSRYLPYVNHLLASCRLRAGDAFGAATLLIRNLTVADSALSRRAFLGLATLAVRMSTSELDRLEHEAGNREARELLQLALLEGKLRQGRLSEVIAGAEQLRAMAAGEDVRRRAAELASTARNLQRGSLRVGVILPLSGPLQAEGRRVLRGIEFAWKRGATSLELVVRDSESDMLRAVQAAQELMRDERVVALIGELESDKSIAIGALAGTAQLPVLVPVSYLTGLTSAAPTVFQLNMDVEHRGRLLAEYAVNELGCRTFATLAPADDYGMEMADAFANRVDELGGVVVAQEWYYDNPQDLTNQFKKIRQLGLHHWIADSLRRANQGGTPPSSARVEAALQALTDSVRRHAKPGEVTNLVDYEDFPVPGIDAIFFPIHAEDIPYVASQFARFNIRAQPLGGSEWQNLELLLGNRRYVEGLVFVTDWFLDESDPVYQQLRDEFRRETGLVPDRWMAYGYDAMSLILKVLAEGATTREEISRRLEGVEKVQGLRGLTTFRGNNRSNAEANLIRFVRGSFQRVH